MNKVFVNQLTSWLLYGELKDPYKEFFIFRNNKEDPSDTFLSSPSTATCDKSLVSTVSCLSQWGFREYFLATIKNNIKLKRSIRTGPYPAEWGRDIVRSFVILVLFYGLD